MLTPSQAIIASAQESFDVTDSAGHTYTIRRPTTLDRLRLFKAVGSALSNNDRYLGLAMLAFTVMAIDGVPQPQPATEAQLEAAVARLSDSAIAAIAAGLHSDDGEELATAEAGN